MALGLLSTARINHEILEGARASDRVEVVAVGSRDRARAEAYAREHDLEKAHGSYEALIEDADVDIIYVSLPNSMHVEWSVRALEAGKHVLCEKPLSRDPDEVERAFEAAEAAGTLLTEAFMYRHHPQTKRVQQLMDEGAIGRLVGIRAAVGFDAVSMWGADDVRLSSVLEGGALMDLGCYCVNSCRLMAGEPESVYSRQVIGESAVDMSFFAMLSFPGDVVAEMSASFVLPPMRQEFEAIGDQGRIRLEAPWRVDFGGSASLIREGSIEPIEVEEANAYQLELENLADAIEGRRELLLGRDDALGQARTIDALFRSAESGEPIALAPS